MTGTDRKPENLIEVQNLRAHFPVTGGLLSKTVGHIKAVDGASFHIKVGETVGLVGESGSGKTTLGRCIVRLVEPTEGSIKFRMNGEMIELTKLNRREIKAVRRKITMLFQDPNSSLNPRLRVGDIVAEPLKIHEIGTREEQLVRVQDLLIKVGLSAGHVSMYPHQFSGGQRQRIGIARALSVNPHLVICDEPVSALDVSVQAQVLNLLAGLQKELKLTYLFIAHDLSVVEYVSDRVMVMYLGNIVEIAPAEQIYKRPKHPYTEGLLAAIPRRQVGVMRRFTLTGNIPDPSDPPTGCAFHTRCPYAQEICKQVRPNLEPSAIGNESFVACHRAEELELRGYS